MNCDDLQDLLVAYANGELTGTQKDFIEDHLNGCVNCRMALEDYKNTKEKLLTLRHTPDMPATRKEEIMSEIRMENTRSYLKRLLRPAAIAVPVCLLLVIVLALQFTGVFSGTSGVIAKAYTASTSLGSFRYVKDEYARETPAAEPVHIYHAEMAYSAPDSFHTKTRSFISEMPPNYPETQETVRIGDDVYVNIPKAFYKVDAEWFERLSPTRDKTLDLLNLLDEVETFADESINGTDCYHYAGTVNTGNFLEWSRPDFENIYYRTSRNLPGGMSTDLDTWIEDLNDNYRNKTMTYEFWIGKDDYLIRKGIVTYQAKDGAQAASGAYLSTGIMYYYDFNEDIMIKSPLDESGRLLAGWSSYALEELEIPEVHDVIPDIVQTSTGNSPETQKILDLFAGAPPRAVTLDSFRLVNKNYSNFDDELCLANTVITERGGHNLFRRYIESTQEYVDLFPALGMKVELILVGDRVYTRDYPVVPESTGDIIMTGPTPEDMLHELEMLVSIETLPDEVIDGTDCYHYRGVLDVEEYLEWFEPQYRESTLETHEKLGMKVDIDIAWQTTQSIYRSKETIHEYWIGKEDHLLRKSVMIERKLRENPLPPDDLSDTPTRKIVKHYQNYNEPVEIRAPLDESGGLLEGWVMTVLEE